MRLVAKAVAGARRGAKANAIVPAVPDSAGELKAVLANERLFAAL
jgi:hypothetical protein